MNIIYSNLKKLLVSILAIFLFIGVFGISRNDIFAEDTATIEYIYGYGRNHGKDIASSAISDGNDNTGYSYKGGIIKDSITSTTGSSANRFSQSIAAKTALTGTEFYYDDQHVSTNKDTTIRFNVNGKTTQLFAVAYNETAYYCRLTPAFTSNPKNTKIIEHYNGEYTVSINDSEIKDVSINNYYIVKNPDTTNYEFYIPSDKYSYNKDNEGDAISLSLTTVDNYEFSGLEFTVGNNKYYYDGETNGTAYLNASTGEFEDTYNSNDILKYENGTVLFYKINSNINIKYLEDLGSHTVTFYGLEKYNLLNPEPLTVKHNRAINSFNPLSSTYIEYQGVNYKFEDWYLDEQLTNKYDFSTPISDDLVLYCKLIEKVEHKIVFNNVSTLSSTTNWSALDATTKTINLEDDFHAVNPGEQVQFSVYELADDNVSSIDIKIGNNTYTLVNEGLESLLYSKGLYLDLNCLETSFNASDVSNLTLKYAHSTSSDRNMFYWRFYNVTSDIDITVHLKPYTLNYYVDNEIYDTETINYGLSLDDLGLNLPVPPNKEGKYFMGWYSDSEYQYEFDASTKITENTLTLYAKFEDMDTDLSQQVVLNNDGTLGVNLKFSLNKTYVLSDNDYLYAKIDGEYYKVNKEIEGNYQTYTYKINNISPSEMTNNFKAQLYISDKNVNSIVSKEYTLCIRDCLDMFIDEYESRDVGLANFAKAILNYGASCQTYFDVDPTNLANSILSEDDKNIGSDYVVSQDNEYQTSGSLQGISAYGYNLSLNSNTDMKVYFMIDKDKNINDYTFIDGEKTLEANLYKGRVYYVTLSNVAYPDLDEMHDIEVTNSNYNGSKLIVSCNPLSYVYSQINSQDIDAELSDLLNKLNIVSVYSNILKKSIDGEYVLSYYSYDEDSNGVINKNLFYQNINEEWLADPSYIYITDGRDAGYYYVYGTTASLNETCIGAWRSKNLTDWQFVGPVFIPDRQNGWQYFKGIWAPQVIYDPDDSKYYLFYSCPWGYNEETPFRYDSCAVSDNPYGPFVELNNNNKSSGEPLLVFENHFNELPEDIQNEHANHYGFLQKKGYIKAIGPSPFIDPKTGDKYIFFCQDLSSSDSALSQSGGYCIKMKNKNWSTPDYSTVKRVTLYNHITTDKSSALANELNDTNEGPMCFYNSKTDKYYLFFLTSKYMLKDYQTRIAISNNPDGPYTKLQVNEGAQVMYAENSFKRQATGIHGIIETDDKQVYAAWMTFMNNSFYNSSATGDRVNDGRRKFAIDELVYVKNSYGSISLQANGPSVTPQPLPKSMSGYSNIADEATVKFLGEMTDEENARLKYINDGVIPYHNNSLSTDGTKSLEFATSKKTIELEFDFEDYKTLKSVMVYNSKTAAKQFSQIDSITFNFKKNGIEGKTTIGPIKYNSSYSDLPAVHQSEYQTNEYVELESLTALIGGAAICEFDEIDVKSVIIRISKPTGQQFINIPEIYLLGKDYDGSSNTSLALTGSDYSFDNTSVENGEIDPNNCPSLVKIDGTKENYYGTTPVKTLKANDNNYVDIYSFKGNDGLYMYFDITEKTLKKSSSSVETTHISNSSHIEFNLNVNVNSLSFDENSFRFIIDYSGLNRRQTGAKVTLVKDVESERKARDISFYSSIIAKTKTGGYVVELFIPYSQFGINNYKDLGSIRYELLFAYNNSNTLTSISTSSNGVLNRNKPENWTSIFTPSYVSVQ